jgi:hypothetical protein
MSARGLVTATGALLSSLLTVRAYGQPATFELPPACGTEDEFRAELVRLVGVDAERAWPSMLQITHDDASATYVLRLEVGGRARELSHADCRVLFRSALVVAAASVRPAEPEPKPKPKVVPEPPSEPAPKPEPAASKPPARAPDATPPFVASVALGTGLALGVVPGADAAFELRGGVSRGPFGGSFAARYLPARFVSSDGRGVDIQGVGFRLAGVVSPVRILALSAGLDADWLSGSGRTGIDKPSSDSAWTLAPSLEAALIPFETRHLALELALEGRLALQRPHFEVTGFRQVYEVPPWGMFAFARGGWRFP